MKMHILQQKSSLIAAIFFTVLFSALSAMFTSLLFFKLLLAVFMAISVVLGTSTIIAKCSTRISTTEERDDGKNRKYFGALKHSEGTRKLSMEASLNKEHDDDFQERGFTVKKHIKGNKRSFTMKTPSRASDDDQKQEQLLYQENSERNNQSLTVKALLRELDGNRGQDRYCDNLKLAIEALLLTELHGDQENEDLFLQKNTESKIKLLAMEALLRKLCEEDQGRQECSLEKTSAVTNTNLRPANITMCRRCRRVASVPEDGEEREERRGYGEDFQRCSRLLANSSCKLQSSSCLPSFKEQQFDIRVCNKKRRHIVEASADHDEDEESIIKHQILPVERCESDHMSAKRGDTDAAYDKHSSTFPRSSCRGLSDASCRATDVTIPGGCSSSFATNPSRRLNKAKYGVNDALLDRFSSTSVSNSNRRLNEDEDGVDDGVSDTNTSRGLNDAKSRVNDGVISIFASNCSRSPSKKPAYEVNDVIYCRINPTVATNSNRRKNGTCTVAIEEITDAELQDAAGEFYTLEGDVLWTECDPAERKKNTDQCSQYPGKVRFDPYNVVKGLEIIHNADAILQGQVKQNGKLMITDSIKVHRNADLMDEEAIKNVHYTNLIDDESIKVHQSIYAMDHESKKTIDSLNAMDHELVEMVGNVDVMDDESISIVHSVDSVQSQIKQPAKPKVAGKGAPVQEVRDEIDEEMIVDERLRAIAFRSENKDTGDESNYMSMPGSFRELEAMWSPSAEDGQCMDMDIHKREESNYTSMLSGCCDDHGKPCMAHSKSRSKVLQTDPLLSKASLSLREQEIMDILWQEQYNEHRSICLKKGSKTRMECDNSGDKYINLHGCDCSSNRHNKNTFLFGCKNKACWHNLDKDQRGYHRRRYFIGICRALREIGLKKCLQSSNVNN